MDTQANLILLHYVGDQNIVTDYPLGNSHHSQSSALEKLKNNTDLPGNIYKKIIALNNCPLNYECIMKPRNSKQIANLQQGERNKSRLTHDALYNLHTEAYDLCGFIITIRTFPDLIVVCGHGSLAEELDGLLQADSEVPQLLSYDTTFQLGDFYFCFGIPSFPPHQLFLVSF